MIVFQSCGKSLVYLYAGSTTAVINVYQIKGGGGGGGGGLHQNSLEIDFIVVSGRRE